MIRRWTTALLAGLALPRGRLLGVASDRRQLFPRRRLRKPLPDLQRAARGIPAHPARWACRAGAQRRLLCDRTPLRHRRERVLRPVWLAHLLNVALLFAAVRRFTGSAAIACVAAILFGTCPAAEGSLGWHAVFGHVLAGTALLAMLVDVAAPSANVA